MGQAPAQVPQLTQAPSSISNLPPASLIAPTGHAPAQVPQPMQVSLILYAIRKHLLLISEVILSDYFRKINALGVKTTENSQLDTTISF